MDRRHIEIEKEVRDAPLSAFHFRVAVVLGMVLFVDGYDLFNAGYVAPYVRREWGLDDQQIGAMLSAGIVGLALGALLQAPVAQWIGRRGAVIAGVSLLGLASLCIATLVQEFTEFLVLRVVLGISLGMLSPLAFVYVNEWAPRKSANLFATLCFVLPFSLGGIAAGIAALFIGPEHGWRGLYWVAAIAFPIACLCFLYLPESLDRLSRQGRHDELGRLLAKIRPDRADIYRAATEFTLVQTAGRTARIRELFAPDYRWRTVGIWVASALSLLCVHGLSGWLPSLLVAKGTAFTSAFGFGVLLMSMKR